MLPAEAACWRAIIAEAPAGVLTSADRGALGMMAQLRSLVETHSADSKSMALLLRCYTELGMTPASRSKVSVKTQKEEENEFAAV